MTHNVPLDTVIELSPSAKTRLIKEPRQADLTHLCITSFLTFISCIITILYIQKNGFEPNIVTLLIICLSFFLLILNAYYGYTAYKQLKNLREMQYTEFVNRLNDARTHERLFKPAYVNITSPVWKENIKSQNNNSFS